MSWRATITAVSYKVNGHSGVPLFTVTDKLQLFLHHVWLLKSQLRPVRLGSDKVLGLCRKYL